MDHAAHIPVASALVGVAEHAPPGDRSGLGASPKRVVGAPARLPAMHLVDQAKHGRVHLVGLVLDANLGTGLLAPDLDAGILSAWIAMSTRPVSRPIRDCP